MDPDRPDETAAERADRNFGDLLQELRVSQTGVQILFAFLLTLPLQARFASFDRAQRAMFVTALLGTAAATICLIAPVACHRALFRHRLKPELVEVANRFAIAGLFFLAIAVVSSVELVLAQVLGHGVAVPVAALLLLAVVVLWVVLPLRLRRLDRRALEGRVVAQATVPASPAHPPA